MEKINKNYQLTNGTLLTNIEIYLNYLDKKGDVSFTIKYHHLEPITNAICKFNYGELYLKTTHLGQTPSTKTDEIRKRLNDLEAVMKDQKVLKYIKENI